MMENGGNCLVISATCMPKNGMKSITFSKVFLMLLCPNGNELFSCGYPRGLAFRLNQMPKPARIALSHPMNGNDALRVSESFGLWCSMP
jgi:hypothetical protein